MATAAVGNTQDTDEPSSLDCPVCHEPFKEPKVLPCGHRLCRPCLLSWGQAQHDAQCPICRCNIIDASSGKKFDEMVEGFPTDLATKVLVECKQLLSKDHVCQACVTQCATSMCVTCGDFFCSNCGAGHMRTTVLHDHKVEDLSSLTPEKVASSRTPICSEHAGRRSEVYCQAHGASVCVLCATTDHRLCSGVQKLEERVKEGRAALQELASTLSTGEGNLDEAVKELDQHLKNTQESITAAAAEVDAKFQHLEAVVKASRQRLEKLLEEASSDIKEAVSEAKNYLLQRRGKLTTHRNLLDLACGMTTPDVISGMTLSMQSRVDSLDCSATLPDGAKVISATELVFDLEVMSRIEREISEMGEVKAIPANIAAQVKISLPFCFHDKHGQNVVLSNNRLTAERTTYKHYGIVMSQNPMEVNMMYEVQVDQTVADWGNQHVIVGFMTQIPDSLPIWAGDLNSAVLVEPNRLVVNRAVRSSSFGDRLCHVREGDRLGLVLDSSRNIYLHINDDCIGVISRSVADPCHFMVDLCVCLKKVTALPVRSHPMK